MEQRTPRGIVILGPSRENQRREMLLEELAATIVDDMLQAVERVNGDDVQRVARDVVKMRVRDCAGRLTRKVLEEVERRRGIPATVYAGVGEVPR